ncbi:DUF3954 domain-containing protein [Peribacillus muralis]|uniref:DUF3954 domain-containing protein n=1 Tax=Peribacillus muralis TaxID=264697 RepID=UPI003D068655
MEAKINLEEDKIYIVRDQEITEVCAPPSGHGTHSCIWINGKVDRVENKFTTKVKKEKSL